MKLKYIALGIGLLTAMFSCSMEDDIVPDTKGQVEGVSEEMYAALQFNISTGTDLNTKATSSVTGPKEDSDYSEVKNNEMNVKQCFVFVANGDEIIGRRHYGEKDLTRSTSGYEYTLKNHIMVKVPSEKPDFTVFVVGMKSDNDNTFANELYSNATSLSALKQSTVGKNSADKGNSLSDFIKVGEGTIKSYEKDPTNGYQTSERTTNFTCDQGTVRCGSANIELSLRAAAIEIVSFKIKDSKGNYFFNSETVDSASETRKVVKDIQLGTTELGGQIVNTVLNTGEATSKVRSYTSYLTGYNKMSKKEKEDSNPMGYRFYTYQNTTDATMITIPYVNGDGRDQSISFSVKTPDESGGYTETVEAGCLYRINVEITNNVANIAIHCYTQDWKEGGSYDIVLKPSNN